METENKNEMIWICCDNGVAIPLSQYDGKNFCGMTLSDKPKSDEMSVFCEN